MDKMLSSGLIRNKKSIELFKFWGNKTMYEYYKSLTLPKLKNIITTGGNKVKGCDIQERKTEITQYKLSTIKKKIKKCSNFIPILSSLDCASFFISFTIHPSFGGFFDRSNCFRCAQTSVECFSFRFSSSAWSFTGILFCLPCIWKPCEMSRCRLDFFCCNTTS